MPKLKREEGGPLSKSERQKLQRLYTQGGAAYGSVRNLVQASNLSVSKVRQFLHSKPSYTKFNLAMREFKRMKAFARLKIEIWCMNLAYVDKLVKDNNGIKYLLVLQDLFDRTLDAKGMKTKGSKETVRAFLSMIRKRNRPKEIWVEKGTEIAGEFEKLCKVEAIQIYSTMSETKAAFAERTIRSLKNIIYPYIKDNGYKYLHKLTQFVLTLNGIVYNRIGFKCICATTSRQYTELFYKLFTRATESGWSMRGCNFRIILPINLPKRHVGKNYVFRQEVFKAIRIL